MNENINLLLVRAVIQYLDRIQELLGDQWPAFRQKLLDVAIQLSEAQSSPLVGLLVDELIDSGRNTPADRLFRELLRSIKQSVEESGDVTRSVKMQDPTTGEVREVMDGLGAREGHDSTVARTSETNDVIAAGRELAEILRQSDSRTFNAFPRLEAPDQVEPEEAFTVVVGFRSDLDRQLNNVMPIQIDNPPEDAQLLVMLIGDGVTVLDGHHRHLTLDMTAEAEFHCQAKPGIEEARLTVDYIYDSQVVGTATRTLKIGRTKKTPIESSGKNGDEEIPHLGSPSPTDYPDLTVSIYKMQDGDLQWSFNAPKPEINLGPIAMKHRLTDDEARRLPSDLIKQLREVQYKGVFAAHTLDNLGQKITDIMPEAFFDVLQQVHEAIGRLPTILLLTQETFVPWELAILEEPLDPNLPPYLATQSHIARWYRHDKVTMPPHVTVNAALFSVVASQYGRGSGQRELTEALKEQDELAEQLKRYGIETTPYEATTEALEKLVTRQRTPGHLVHFAVHGISGPDAADNMLLLADRRRLPASALVGHHKPGETPTFAFVFLNACQVGQAGTSLGQAAGFPGELIRGGALGFIAPLWEVHDEPARCMAEAFYQSTFEKEQSVAGFLQGQRARYDRQGTVTPMAYIFYGHPKLHLHAVSKKTTHG